MSWSIKYILIVMTSIFLVSCSMFSSDEEMSPNNQGNLDPIHDKSKKGNDIATKDEQSARNIITSNVKLFFFKTPPFRFYDYARLNTYRSGLMKMELFKYGQTIGSIRIKNSRMCILTECSYKWPISKKFFGAVSYDTLFEDIVFGRDIFNGRGKMVGPNGMIIQRFVQSGEVIYYERLNGHVLFKNFTKDIIIGLENYIPLSPENGIQNSPIIPQ